VSVERSEKNVFIRCTIGMHNVVSIDKKLEYVSVIVSVFLKIYLLYNFTEGTKFSLKKEALEKKTMFRKEKTRVVSRSRNVSITTTIISNAAVMTLVVVTITSIATRMYRRQRFLTSSVVGCCLIVLEILCIRL
jgi:hypothetical protein